MSVTDNFLEVPKLMAVLVDGTHMEVVERQILQRMRDSGPGFNVGSLFGHRALQCVELVAVTHNMGGWTNMSRDTVVSPTHIVRFYYEGEWEQGWPSE